MPKTTSLEFGLTDRLFSDLDMVDEKGSDEKNMPQA
jgi:hypothetical protein